MTSNLTPCLARLLYDSRLAGLTVSLVGERLQVAASATADEQALPRLRSVAPVLHPHVTARLARGRSVIERIEAAALARPQATALQGRDGNCYTYDQMNALANRYARHLRSIGVGNETRVGVLLTRDAEWIIAILAIMKAGGTYVALAGSMPEERIAGLCRDNALQLLLTTDDWLERLPEFDLAFTQSLTIERLRLDARDLSSSNLALSLQQAQLAYVLFTSGSMGTPKGVMVSHGALENLVAWHIAEYIADPDSVRASQLASQSFDAHVWEIFPYLCAGAALVLADDTVRLDMAGLRTWLAAQAITHCFLPTPLAEVFLGAPGDAGVLRYLLVGGDVLKSTKAPLGCTLVNHYGPTEAAVVATYSYVEAALQVPPIGLPIDQLKAYINDAAGYPAHVSGELCLSGASLARGYLHQPRETADRFVPDPNGEPGTRMYRTGDLVKQQTDGQLVFLARLDQQLKIRGIRIEPSDIEYALMSHPAVTEAAVVQHASLVDSLTAFVTLRSEPGAMAEQDVSGWRELYNSTYESPQTDQAGQDFVGWNNSYDGLPIPQEQMRQWADTTCERILALGGGTLLEIGCGSGLLALRLLPALQSYAGADLSAPALARIEHQLQLAPDLRAKCTLLQAAAHQFERLPQGRFDTIVVNSVSQYFPDAAYFDEVIEAAWARLNPDGALFIGDVRDLRLQDAFQIGVSAARLGRGASVGALRQSADNGIAHEDELMISPQYFIDVGARLGADVEVLVLAKAGAYDNEIARHRYDVVFRRRQSIAAPAPNSGNWPAPAQIDAIAAWCAAQPADQLCLTDIVQYGIATELALAAAIRCPTQADAMRLDQLDVAGCAEVAPGALVAALGQAGWQARAVLNGQAPGRFALQAIRGRAPWPALPSAAGQGVLANDPSSKRRAERIVQQLRQQMRKSVADYLVPARIVVLDALPLTANGKVDRQQLAHAKLPSESGGAGETPATPLEGLIAKWFAEALNLKQVGRLDNLYDLGGNSLLATRLVALINTEIGVQLPVHLILDNPTVADLAAAMSERLGGDEVAAEIVRIVGEDSVAA